MTAAPRSYSFRPLLRASVDETTEARFWAKVRKGPGCWEWTGASGKGYGRFSFDGTVIIAARFAWMLTHGDLDGSIRVGVTCENRLCVRPDHLVATDFAGVHQRTRADLTAEDVVWIRANAAAYTISELAELFAVSTTVVSAVHKGRTWIAAGYEPQPTSRHYKITPVIAEEMRELWDEGEYETIADLAAAFQVAYSTAWMVVHQARRKGSWRSGTRRTERMVTAQA